MSLFQRKVAGVQLIEVAEKAAPASDPHAIAARWAEEFVTAGRLQRSLRDALDSGKAAEVDEALVSLSQRFLLDNELDALAAGLSGHYLTPGLMGDCLRSPDVYPTGRNGCSFDPTRIPFEDAIERGRLLGEGLVQKHVKTNGAPPRTVGLVLWGFETARTGGETIGQLLYLIGGRVRSTRGWLPAFEPIPLKELGRPRVDVYLMICGFFRDMFPTLVRDLDELIKAIGLLDESAEMNPIRAHMRAGQENPDTVSPELTEARIFGPKPGEYGTGLPDYVDNSNWDDNADLGKIYEEAMGYAYGARCHGAPAQSALGALFSRTDAVCQVIDGEEYKIGDLDHYYEFLGGATRAVENRRGIRPLSAVGDTARNNPRISDAKAEIARFAVTRLLNPKWIDGMLAHEIHGGKKIEERVTNLVGLAGTVGVPSELFDRVFERFVDDAGMFERLSRNNRHAAADLIKRMKEADERGMWQADEKQIDTLKKRYLTLEAEIE
jgi:cobalamin biosynthesis Mg chelatase CobN